MQILLVRHGQTLWNVEKRWQGQLDSPLTELGKRQALATGRELRRYLGNVDRVSITTSPLGRAMQTTKIIQAEIEQVVLCSLEIDKPTE